MTPEELEALIDKEAPAAMAENWSIVAGIYFASGNERLGTQRLCCALGACARSALLTSTNLDDGGTIASFLGMSRTEVASFAQGFDGCKVEQFTVRPYYEVGQRARAKYGPR